MATYALLFLGAYTAALISGAAGFGGALLLLPLLVASVGTEQAVPMLTFAQFVGNLSRAGLGFTQIHWKPVWLFLAGALPLSLVGAMSFVELPKDLVTRLVGGAILLFVALRYFGLVELKPGRVLLVTGGAVVGFVSGVVGSAGPLGAAIFLTLGLSPVAYVASEAVTALAMHGVKMAVYQHFIALDRQFWFLAVLMGLAMVLGTLTAKRLIERLSPMRFQHYVAALLVVISVYMVAYG
jgi:uncharacterized membrane protein YfcA